MLSYAPGINYLTDLDAWYAAQNGKVDGVNVLDGVHRHMRNGRALGSYTHIAEISQAYFVAYLVLKSSGIKPNQTNPYAAYKNQKAVWHVRRTGHRRHARRGSQSGAERRLVSEMDRAPASAPGGRRRPRLSGDDEAHRSADAASPSARVRAGVGGALFQPIRQSRFRPVRSPWQLSAVTGVSGRIADVSVLSRRAWRGRRRVHHSLEVFLRRRGRVRTSGRAIHRRLGARSLIPVRKI